LLDLTVVSRAKVNELMDWINANFYRDLGYGLVYPQVVPDHKRRSEEAQDATLERAKQQTKRWLKVLDEHWLGSNRAYLCGDEITIADHFGACLVSLGEVIKVDYSPYPNIQRWLGKMAKLPSWSGVNEAFYQLVASGKDKTFVTIP
jgi:glutathione S-transferase